MRFFRSSRCSLKLQVEPVPFASLIHWAAHKITFISENSFFYLELQIWHGPQWSPSRSGSQNPGYCWVSGSGWSSSHCSPPGRKRQVSYTQKVKWFHIKWFLVFRGVPQRFIAMKSKLLEEHLTTQKATQTTKCSYKLFKWSGFSQIYWKWSACVSVTACRICFCFRKLNVIAMCSWGESCLIGRDEWEWRFRQRWHLVDQRDRRWGSLFWSLIFVTAVLRAFLGDIVILFHILSIAVGNCSFLEAVCLSIGALKRVVHLKGFWCHYKYFS